MSNNLSVMSNVIKIIVLKGGKGIEVKRKEKVSLIS